MNSNEIKANRDKKLLLIDKFLEGRGYELISKKYKEGVVFVLVPKKDRISFKLKFPTQLFKDLLIYQDKHVFKKDTTNCGRGDCFDVAVNAHTDMFNDRTKNGGSGTLFIGGLGWKLPFFLGSGFSNHVVNFLRLPDGKFLAYDLTAHYNIFGEDTKHKIFAMLGKDTVELTEMLKKLYSLK